MSCVKERILFVFPGWVSGVSAGDHGQAETAGRQEELRRAELRTPGHRPRPESHPRQHRTVGDRNIILVNTNISLQVGDARHPRHGRGVRVAAPSPARRRKTTSPAERRQFSGGRKVGRDQRAQLRVGPLRRRGGRGETIHHNKYFCRHLNIHTGEHWPGLLLLPRAGEAEHAAGAEQQTRLQGHEVILRRWGWLGASGHQFLASVSQ